jgi:GNAT superfamily N-acetyltransferase
MGLLAEPMATSGGGYRRAPAPPLAPPAPPRKDGRGIRGAWSKMSPTALVLETRKTRRSTLFAPVTVTDNDVPRVVALINRAYRGLGTSSSWSTEASYLSGDRTTEELLRADLVAKPEASLLKWEEAPGDPLLGCVWLESLGDDVWYLGSLAIDPEQQKGGLGRVLLNSAEQWVRERGGRRVRMSVVNVREALIAWYLRRGYHETGETNPFPYGDDRFGMPLRDDLGFVVLEKDLALSDGVV